MTTTQTAKANGKAVRAFLSAEKCLADAEHLEEVLRVALADDEPNDYMRDAWRHAVELVAEMNRELDYVMETYTPEECGL